MKLRTLLLLAGLLSTPLLAQAHDYHAGQIHIDHPWSREMPPSAPPPPVYYAPPPAVYVPPRPVYYAPPPPVYYRGHDHHWRGHHHHDRHRGHDGHRGHRGHRD